VGLIIDTGVFIKWEKTGRIVDFAQRDQEGDAAISVVTMSELLVGVRRANTRARREKRSAFVEAILAQIQTVVRSSHPRPGSGRNHPLRRNSCIVVLNHHRDIRPEE